MFGEIARFGAALFGVAFVFFWGGLVGIALILAQAGFRREGYWYSRFRTLMQLSFLAMAVLVVISLVGR